MTATVTAFAIGGMATAGMSSTQKYLIVLDTLKMLQVQVQVQVQLQLQLQLQLEGKAVVYVERGGGGGGGTARADVCACVVLPSKILELLFRLSEVLGKRDCFRHARVGACACVGIGPKRSICTMWHA